MSLFQSVNAIRKRVHIESENLGKCVNHVNESKICDIVNLIDGNGLSLLKNVVINRFAKEITSTDGSDENITLADVEDQTKWKTKVDIAAATAYSTGMHSLNSMYGFQKIVNSRATLYRTKSVYTYTNVGDWASELYGDRSRSQHNRRMSRIDKLACSIGSCGGWVKTNVSGYQYENFDPSKIWVAFAGEIYLNNTLASVNKNDIDDATVVIIKLGGQAKTDGASNYIAMFGASNKYPLGRVVKFEADKWDKIPDVGDGGFDHLISGDFSQRASISDIANPLTLYRNKTAGESKVEYPVFSWQMDDTADGTSVFPASGTMLFDLMMDMDAESSRNTESGGRSGRGAWFGSDPRTQGFDQSISEGESLLKREQDVRLLSHPASNAKDAMEILSNNLQQIASANNVPPHMVAVLDTMSVNSGFQLQVMNQPLARDRIARAEINRSNAARKFQIERALLNAQSAKDIIPLDTEEYWEPGPQEELKTPQEIRDDLTWKFDNGFLSVIEHMMEMRNLETKEQAIEALEMVKQENAQFKASSAPEAVPETARILSRKAV